MDILTIEQTMQAVFVELDNLLKLERIFEAGDKAIIQTCSIKLNQLLLKKVNDLSTNYEPACSLVS